MHQKKNKYKIKKLIMMIFLIFLIQRQINQLKINLIKSKIKLHLSLLSHKFNSNNNNKNNNNLAGRMMTLQTLMIFFTVIHH